MRSIIKESDAVAVFRKLQNDNEAVDFYSYFGKFKKEKRRNFIHTSSFFNALWERFKDKPAKTGLTSIHIPIEHEVLEYLKVLKTVLIINDIYDVIGAQNRIIVTALTTLLYQGKDNRFKVC
jgi:hypothetical protein